MIIRDFQASDLQALVTVFQQAVHELAAGSYTPEQRAAWAPASPDLERWREQLAALATLVADVDGDIAGFLAFSAAGHIDLLYTSPGFARRGVASRLFHEALHRLQTRGVRELSTEASLEARPFFETQGFSTVSEQVVERDGVALTRYLMTRALGHAPDPATWYVADLGDAMLAGEQQDRVEHRFAAAYQQAGRPPAMAVFIRHESKGGLHCHVKLYFAPRAASVAEAVPTRPCGKPAPDGLGLFAGSPDCWSVLFPD
ncbi:MAG: GNAT family N-acetyltransferase [Pseudomonadota bacterium]|nr:GNAT family N-acetyltransferase [Pseudomonadota bacterium]